MMEIVGKGYTAVRWIDDGREYSLEDQLAATYEAEDAVPSLTQHVH